MIKFKYNEGICQTFLSFAGVVSRARLSRGKLLSCVFVCAGLASEVLSQHTHLPWHVFNSLNYQRTVQRGGLNAIDNRRATIGKSPSIAIEQ